MIFKILFGFWLLWVGSSTYSLAEHGAVEEGCHFVYRGHPFTWPMHRTRDVLCYHYAEEIADVRCGQYPCWTIPEWAWSCPGC